MKRTFYHLSQRSLRAITPTLLALTFIAILTSAVHAQISVDLTPGNRTTVSDAYFTKNRATLDKKKQAELDALGNYLKARPELKVEIGSHWADKKQTGKAGIKLSEGRAAALKSYLVKKFSLNTANLLTKGYGDASPVDVAVTPAAIATNRRIEVVALTSLTSRPVSQAGNAVNYEGILSYQERNVQSKGPWDIDFATARQRQQLFERHQVQTYDRARAEIAFNDGSKSSLGENSMVIIGVSPDFTGRTGANIELQKGILLARPKNTEIFSIKGPAVDIDLNSTRTKVIVDPTRTTVSVFQGKAKVKSNGTTVEIIEGFGTVIPRGASPEAPRALPESPLPTAPADGETMPATGTQFTWRPAAPRVRLEVARDPEMTSVVTTILTDKTEETVKLDPGSYYWQVSSVDASGVEGKPSAPRRVVVSTGARSTATGLDALRRAKLDLTEFKEGFSTVNNSDITLRGVVDTGSTVYVNGSRIPESDVRPDGSFYRNVPLRRGDNKIVVEATDKSGAENRKTLIIKYVEINRFRFGVAIAPVVPLNYSSFNAGIAGNLNLTYLITRNIGAKFGLGIGGFTNTIGGTAAQSGITEFYMFDAGINYDFTVGTTVVPFIEANAGLFAWTGHRYVAGEVRGAGVFAPGVGAGLKFGGQGRYFGLGGYYRFILDGAGTGLDPASVSSSHGLFEIRLVMTFE
ncbi:MAG: OmpA family protein [Rhizobacter sp.]|nr:OmpA family protein [Chlorobiales bacterium]